MNRHEGNAIADLDNVIGACIQEETDYDAKIEMRSSLLDFEIIDVVKGLQKYLLSDNSGMRREAVSTLSWLAGCHPRINTSSIPHMIAFFCSRLSDWASVEPSIQGIRTLYVHHVKPGSGLEYVEESETSISRDRSDLSLMLGLAGSSSLPPQTNSMTERVMWKLLIHVHAPSFGQQVRFEVLELFKLWISRFSEELGPVSDIVIKGLAIEGEDERDAECLSCFFEAIDLLFVSGLAEKSPKALEELFDTIKSYFPVQFVAREKDSEHLPRLKNLLSKCMVHFKLQSIEYLTPHLNDPTLAEDAYLTLLAIGQKSPNELIPFLLAEYNTAGPSILLKRLWQSTITAADSRIVEGLVSRLVESQGEEALLVVLAEKNSHVLQLVLSQYIAEGRPLESFVGKLDYENNSFEQIAFPESLANACLSHLDLGSESERCLRFAAALIRFVNTKEDISVLNPVLSFIESALNSCPYIPSEGVSDCIASLAQFHANIFFERINPLEIFSRMICENSPVTGIIALSLQRTDRFDDSFISAIKGEKFDLLLSAFGDESFANCFACRFLENGLIQTCELSSRAIGELVSHLSDPGAITKNLVLSEGRLDIIPFLGVDQIRHAIHGEPLEVWEDLLCASLSLSEESARCVVPIVASAAWPEYKDGMVRILAHCENDSVWAAAMRTLAVEEKIGKIIFDQISIGRIQNLLFPLNANNIVHADLVTDLTNLLRQSPQDEIDPKICVRILSALSPPDLLIEESALVEKSLMLNDIFAYKLFIKYLIVNQNLKESVLASWIEQICSFLLCEEASSSVIERFAAVQALSVAPEVVPGGKLKSVIPHSISALTALLDREPKHVIRKQIAVAITNWFSIS